MKRIFLIIYLIFPLQVIAEDFATTCPTGYKKISEANMILSSATTCPSGYIAAGTADSCLIESPSGNCIMYIPAGVSYVGDVGIYEYQEPCPLE